MLYQKHFDAKKVQVWVRAGESFLFLHTKPERGGRWQPVTGHVEKGETEWDAATREVFEETGFSGMLRSLEMSFFYQARGLWYRESGFVMLVDPAPVILDSHEHDASSWQVQEGLYPLQRCMMQQAAL